MVLGRNQVEFERRSIICRLVDPGSIQRSHRPGVNRGGNNEKPANGYHPVWKDGYRPIGRNELTAGVPFFLIYSNTLSRNVCRMLNALPEQRRMSHIPSQYDREL